VIGVSRAVRYIAVAAALCLIVPAPVSAQEAGSRDCLRMVGPIDLQTSTVADIQGAFASGALTSRQLVEAYLARIEFYERVGVDNAQDQEEDDYTNSIRHLNPAALDIADQLDAERAAGTVRGPLHGIPVLLKDNVGTDDMPTTAGSIALENAVPKEDAPIVDRLEDAGAIVLGKTNLSEFANWVQLGMPNGYSSLGGQVHNPYHGGDPSGSSSGSGAAAATALAQLTIGTETSGSILSPSTANGIVGIKPTVGLASRRGIIPLAPSFDIPGPMVRNVTDAAALLSVIAGPDPGDATPPHVTGDTPPDGYDYTGFLNDKALEGVRLGVAQNDASPARFQEALDALRAQGATIVMTDKLVYTKNVGLTEIGFIPNEFKASLNRYLAKQVTDGHAPPTGVETLADIIEYNKQHPDRVKYGQNLLEASEATPGQMNPATDAATLGAAIAPARATIEAALRADDLDAILGRGNTHANIGAAAGYPSITVPAGYSNAANTNPFNISFLGTAYSEARLISYAYDYEQATNLRVPPTELDSYLPSSC
jgi:amidase